MGSNTELPHATTPRTRRRHEITGGIIACSSTNYLLLFPWLFESAARPGELNKRPQDKPSSTGGKEFPGGSEGQVHSWRRG